MKNIRVNVHDEETNIVRKERNSKNVPVINNISAKGKSKMRKSAVYVGYNSWVV